MDVAIESIPYQNTDDEYEAAEQTARPSTVGLPLERKNRLRFPTGTSSDESVYWGARVFEPQPGKHKHVIYCDLWSLYPNTMRSLNLSQETVVGNGDKLEQSQYDGSDCNVGLIDPRPVKRIESHEDVHDYTDGDYKFIYKYSESQDTYQKKWEHPDGPQYEPCYFLKSSVRKGIISEMIDDFMVLKADAKGTDKYDGVKAIVNSAYGTVGYATKYNAFRCFDIRMAETISLMGRKIITYTAHFIRDYIESEYDREAYITHGDTDGVGIAQPSADGRQDAMRAVQDAMDTLNGGGYREWFEEECGLSDDDEIWMEVEMEYYAPSIYCHSAKKRYGIHRRWDEGEEVDDISLTGFSAIRSDTANITQRTQREVLEILLRNDEDEAKEQLYQYVREKREEILNGEIPLEDMGVRGGIQKDLESYGSSKRRPQPVYRSSKYSKKYIDGEGGLGKASKPMYWPIKDIIDDDLPRRYDSDTAEDGDRVDFIAAENVNNIKNKVKVDRDIILQKRLKDRINPIFSVMDWSWDDAIAGTEDSALEDFM